jgi:hypothetical protein
MKEESMVRTGEHFPWRTFRFPAVFAERRRNARRSSMHKGVNDAMEHFLCQANGTDDTLGYS